jgi:hypothetical protein
VKGRAFILPAVALLSSCSPPQITISASRIGARTMVTLSQDWGILFHDRRPPCVAEVSLYVTGDRGAQPAWRIESTGERNCSALGSLVIGQVPAGFRESAPLSAPVHGRYELLVRGIGYGEASLSL